MKRRYITLVVVLSLLYLFLPMIAPVNDGTSYSPRHDGTKAFFLLLQRRGTPVERFLNPFSELKTTESGSVFIITGGAKLPGEEESYQPLFDWVKHGNTLLYFASPHQPAGALRKLLDFRVAPTTRLLDNLAEDSVTPQCGNEFASACAQVSKVSFPSAFKLSPGEQWTQVINSRDNTYAATQAIGNGRVWVFSGLTNIANEGIDRFDNAKFLLNIVTPAKRILLDEYHHGFIRPVSHEMKARWENALILMIVLGVWLAFGALSRAARFGPPTPKPHDETAASTELVTALGLLLSEHHAAKSLRSYYRSWKSRACRQFKLPDGVSDGQLLEEMINHSGGKPLGVEGLQSSLTRLAAAEDEHDWDFESAIALLESALIELDNTGSNGTLQSAISQPAIS